MNKLKWIVRPLIAIILTITLCYMIYARIDISKEFLVIYTMVLTFYFKSRDEEKKGEKDVK